MRELLFSVTKKDLRVDTFRSGGPGGQNQNKRNTGVRITHLESGAVGESREHRTQLENRKAAFHRLVEHPKWKVWHARTVAIALGQEPVDVYLERSMVPRNLKVEVRKDGKWVLE
jgi:hypothetical protein